MRNKKASNGKYKNKNAINRNGETIVKNINASFLDNPNNETNNKYIKKTIVGLNIYFNNNVANFLSLIIIHL
jgi:hypothetical protein